MAGLVYSHSFGQKPAERKSPKKYFLFVFRSDDWPGIRTRAFTSNKPTQYLLDHCDFIFINLSNYFVKNRYVWKEQTDHSLLLERLHPIILGQCINWVYLKLYSFIALSSLKLKSNAISSDDLDPLYLKALTRRRLSY